MVKETVLILHLNIQNKLTVLHLNRHYECLTANMKVNLLVLTTLGKLLV